MGYIQALRDAMSCVENYPNAIVLGQTVQAGGSGMSKTFTHLSDHKLLEMPVAENMQMGMSIGLSLAGYHPVISVYPRINFLMDAIGILTGELDKICDYSDYRPRVIIRTAIAHPEPMDPGPQHLGNYVEALRHALTWVNVFTLQDTASIPRMYKYAFDSELSTILIEYMSLYDE